MIADGWVLIAVAPPGSRQDEAIAELRGYLMRAVMVYLSHRRTDAAGRGVAELDQLAEDSVQDALASILTKGQQFRGDSKFTTWAWQVAVHAAAARLRRTRRPVASLDHIALEDGRPLWACLADPQAVDPEGAAQRSEVVVELRRALEEDLTEWQREVLTAIALRGEAPSDVALRLGTSRNNVYKVLHDARRRLRLRMQRRGLSFEDLVSSAG